jgi:hypothetical protein
MSEFSFLADVSRTRHGTTEPVRLALWLAQTPCGPLYQRHVSPDAELAAAVDTWLVELHENDRGPTSSNPPAAVRP